MARGRKNHDGDDNDPPSMEHNSEARAEMIRSVCSDLKALEEERLELSQQITSLRQERIKGQLGMKIADFNAAYRLYNLEDDRRSAYLDTLHETFRALGVGMQSSFLRALDESAPAPKPNGGGKGNKGDGGEKPTAEAAGFNAGKAGKKAKSNPYPVGTLDHDAWHTAWLAGQGENVVALGGGAAGSA